MSGWRASAWPAAFCYGVRLARQLRYNRYVAARISCRLTFVTFRRSARSPPRRQHWWGSTGTPYSVTMLDDAAMRSARRRASSAAEKFVEVGPTYAGRHFVAPRHSRNCAIAAASSSRVTWAHLHRRRCVFKISPGERVAAGSAPLRAALGGSRAARCGPRAMPEPVDSASLMETFSIMIEESPGSQLRGAVG
jgi:hypothetical protein